MDNKIAVEFTEQEARDTIQAYEAAVKAAPSSLNVAQVVLPLATKVQLALNESMAKLRTAVPAVCNQPRREAAKSKLLADVGGGSAKGKVRDKAGHPSSGKSNLN